MEIHDKEDWTENVLDRIGKRKLHYKDKSNRDKAFNILKAKGIHAKKSTSSNQKIHPEYIEDYVGQIEVGFGNDMYNTFFKKLFNIEILE